MYCTVLHHNGRTSLAVPRFVAPCVSRSGEYVARRFLRPWSCLYLWEVVAPVCVGMVDPLGFEPRRAATTTELQSGALPFEARDP